MTTPVVAVHELGLTLPTPSGPRPILTGVSFSIQPGEALGLVGESGSGKSLTARCLTKLLPAGAQLTGSVTIDMIPVFDLTARELRRLRGSKVAMIFQDPRAYMNPVHTIGDFLVETLRTTSSLTRSAAATTAVELLDLVRIDNGPARMKQYPHELSGGLLQRVMIAGALARDPLVLIADEPTTALDVTTQSDVMATVMELRVERGLALLFITHDLELAAATCDRTAVMYAGHIVEERPSHALHHDPRHPYTIGLLRSRPQPGDRGRELFQMPGRPAESSAGPGCSFAPRCTFTVARCFEDDPVDQDLSDGHVVCDRIDAVAADSTQVPTQAPAGPADRGISLTEKPSHV